MTAQTTQKEFEALPKYEQNFRWALFLASNGYEKELTAHQIQEIYQKYYSDKKPLKFYPNGGLK